MSDQFLYDKDDLLDFDVETLNASKIIAALLTIESANPGTLKHVLRLMALIADDWCINTSSSDPVRALMVQKELEEWLSS